jgi:hypothetical protein
MKMMIKNVAGFHSFDLGFFAGAEEEVAGGVLRRGLGIRLDQKVGDAMLCTAYDRG